MIQGIGTDIVSIKRISALYKKSGEKFARKILSEEELKIFQKKDDKINYLSRRFAGKEAVSKALGTGIGKLNFSDISILNDKKGKPFVEINPNYKNLQKLNFHISLSDEKEGYAIAVAIYYNGTSF